MCCCVCLLGIVNVPSSAIKVSDLIIVEKVCAVSSLRLNHNFICLLWTGAWRRREFGIRKVDMMGITFSSSFVRDCSLNTGLLEGCYLQLVLSPLIRWKCIHGGNFLNCSFLLCELEVRMVARCLSSSFLI